MGLKQQLHSLAVLGRRLAGVRAVEVELARRIASRFNVFDYLQTEEHGLSRVVADLLDPGGPHGQGTLFLESFVRLVDSPHLHPFLRDERRLDECKVVVTRERAIDTGEPDLDAPRRLDIRVVVEAANEEPSCIAIENKPYAGDRDNQVNAYREWLARTYGGRFLLIYLSPHGGRPGNNSLPEDACTDGLATMSYCPVAGEASDDVEELRLGSTLADWLAKCAETCRVDRLTWFLRDAEAFCHKRFGGTMTTPSEQEEVRKFILENEDNALAALAVFETWPKTRNDIVARFLGRLESHINERIGLVLGEAAGEFQVASDFTGSASNDGIWACREAWIATGDIHPYVGLAHDGRDPNSWYLSVWLDTSGSSWPGEERLQVRLGELLSNGKHSSGWPWFRYLEGDYADWSPLVFRMQTEPRQPGELVEDIGREFLEFAKVAVPIVDEVLTKQDPP